MSYPLPEIRRPVRPVTLPGGSVVHVRGLTLAELREIDAAAAAAAEDDTGERAISTAVLVAASALAAADGSPLYPGPRAQDLGAVAGVFTPDQFDAIFKAAVGRDLAAAKNG